MNPCDACPTILTIPCAPTTPCASCTLSTSTAPMQEAAEPLRKGEYYNLSPHQRLAVLRTLLDLALNSEVGV